MEHYLTYKKLIELIENNLPIKMKSFSTGDLSYLGKENNPDLYPLMHIVPNQITYNENTTQFTLSILFCDIVNTDMSNEVTVISDMNLSCRDFLSQIKLGVFYDYFDTELPNTSTTFLERFNDHLAGVELTIPVTIFEDMNACDQYEQSIVIGGGFTLFNGNTRNRMIKLNSDGTEDTSFYINLGTGFNNLVETTSIQSDEKIVVGGGFTDFSGNTRNRLVRLNSDGTEDTSFYTNLGTGFNNRILSTYLQSDGKILVTGLFTSFNGNTRNRLIRLNSNGTEDTSFYTNLGTGFNSTVFLTDIQSDGKIVVGGAFTSFNGNTRNRLIRLNSDGTEDTSFYTNLGTGFNNPISIVNVQSDGKIVVGGTFTSFNGNIRNRLIRLNSNGTEDTSFYTNLGTGFNNGTVDAIDIQTDGKILVGGFFTSFNGNTRNYFVRLNSNGTEDTLFYTNLGTGFNITVFSIDVQRNGKILVGGAFTSFNGNTRNRLLRLNSDGIEDTSFYTNLGTGFNSGISENGISLT